MHINIEIKARTSKHDCIRQWLLAHDAQFIGTDLQTDTYFQVRNGRLKLREGKFENNLIHYFRPDAAAVRRSDFTLVPIVNGLLMKEVLGKALGVLTEVIKKREIYYLANVKFHLDSLDGYGTFLEIEAGNIHAHLTSEELNLQCRYYMQALGIEEDDLVGGSYADMVKGSEQ